MGEKLKTRSHSSYKVGWAAVICVGFFLLLPVAKVAPQTISGDVIDQTSGLPVIGAFVLLIDEDSSVVDRSLTDAYGRFSVSALSPGRYALKSAIIGFRSTVSQYFDLVADQSIALQFVIPGFPISLPTLVVEDNRTCGGPPEAGLAAATVWDEAKKALEAAYWTEQQGTLRHVTVQYERELDPQSLEIRQSHQRVVSDIYQGSPFRTGDPELLADSGFIHETAENQWRHLAPDPSVLLSEAFADYHCFSTVRGEGDMVGYIGLEFEPDPGREVPDIDGILWLDARTAELRFLDFGYTRTPYLIGADQVGGRLEFERLPQGPWVVRRWWIRMPIHGTRRGAYSDFVNEAYLARIKEDGGYIQEIQTLDGEVVGGRGVATISGRALNLQAGGEPLVGVEIVLVGTNYTTPTDNQGRFRFDGLPEGMYWLSYGPRTLSALGFVPPIVEVSIAIDESPFVTMAIPSISRLWTTLCPNSEFRTDVGILSGFIRDSVSLEPIPRAQVLATRIGGGLEGESQAELLGEGETDWAGYYRVCDVPEDLPFRIEARAVDDSLVVTDTTTASLEAGDIIRIDFLLPISGRRPQNPN